MKRQKDDPVLQVHGGYWPLPDPRQMHLSRIICTGALKRDSHTPLPSEDTEAVRRPRFPKPARV